MIGNDSKIGYISQDTYLDSDESIYSYLTNGNDDFDKSLIFTLLVKFNIRYEDKDKLYKDLSPGERTRVNIVKLVLNNINILILDEITNHLDKEALDLIYELVSDFPGTIISVSHNRKYNEYLNSNIELDIRDGKVLNKSLRR
jgi:ATPase subunit of ABC transporter with duplicated ATPase domains